MEFPEKNMLECQEREKMLSYGLKKKKKMTHFYLQSFCLIQGKFLPSQILCPCWSCDCGTCSEELTCILEGISKDRPHSSRGNCRNPWAIKASMQGPVAEVGLGVFSLRRNAWYCVTVPCKALLPLSTSLWKGFWVKKISVNTAFKHLSSLLSCTSILFTNICH